MSGSNLVVFGGNLGKAGEMRYFESGKCIWENSIALDQGKDKDPAWVSIEAWGRTAELLGEHFPNKGQFLMFEGRLTAKTWTTDSGEKRSKLVAVAERIIWTPGGRQ